jgi:hypothetical protein
MFIKNSYIGRLSNGKWRVYSSKGRTLGTYSSKKQAEKRLQQIEMFKHMDKKKKKRKAELNMIYTKIVKSQELPEPETTKTYSSIMRDLNKNEPDKLQPFMVAFKDAFDEAIENDIDNPDQVALLEALSKIGDIDAN